MSCKQFFNTQCHLNMISKMTCSYWQLTGIENFPFTMSLACSFRIENTILFEIVDPRSPEQWYRHKMAVFMGHPRALVCGTLETGSGGRQEPIHALHPSESSAQQVGHVCRCGLRGPRTDCRALGRLCTGMYPQVCPLTGTSRCWVRRRRCLGKRTLEQKTATPS